jgi:hypothetical protein
MPVTLEVMEIRVFDYRVQALQLRRMRHLGGQVLQRKGIPNLHTCNKDYSTKQKRKSTKKRQQDKTEIPLSTTIQAQIHEAYQPLEGIHKQLI